LIKAAAPSCAVGSNESGKKKSRDKKAVPKRGASARAPSRKGKEERVEKEKSKTLPVLSSGGGYGEERKKTAQPEGENWNDARSEERRKSTLVSERAGFYSDNLQNSTAERESGGGVSAC